MSSNSSSAAPQSPNVSMLRELLAAEKEITRAWLQAEMDRLVDPMLDSIFNRLETKLTNGLEGTQSTGAAGDFAQVNSTLTDRPLNVSQAVSLIGQASTSTSLSSSLTPPLSHFTPHHVNLNYSQPLPIDPSTTGQSSPTSPVPLLPVSITNDQSRQMSIEQELEAIKNELLYEDLFLEYLSTNKIPIVNEQSIAIFANWHGEDEEESDSDECVDGIDEEEDDSDSVQRIEHDDELSPPAKKPKIDPTQLNNAQPEVIGESSAQPTVALQLEAQPNQVNKQFTTVHLQCLLSHCPDTFPEDQLNRHMLDKHGIGPHRCLVKDCAQSFNKNNILSDHIKQVHPNTTQWHCKKCAKHYSTYRLLSSHNIEYHQRGLFNCSFPACTFTGECKGKMYDHYKQHKQTLKCPHPDCHYETKKVSHLKQHQRAHLGIKPYRCKWPNCDHAGTQKARVITHIRVKHLAPKPGSVPNEAQLDPNDYVEVVNES